MRWLIAVGSFLRIFFRLRFCSALKFLASRFHGSEVEVFVRGQKSPIFFRGSSSDAWVLNSVVICQEYKDFIDFVPRTILDGGANIGLASVYWHQQFPIAEIVAVEPDPENCRLARKNLGDSPQVHVLQGGLWSRDVKLSITNSGDENYALRVSENPDHGTIQAFSIASIMRDRGWSVIDVLKLDVEGSEVELLSRNIEEWIGCVNVLIVELHQQFAPSGAEVLFRAFSNRTFNLRWRGEDLVITRRPRLEHN
jgi:FkbM family methyltransferase